MFELIDICGWPNSTAWALIDPGPNPNPGIWMFKLDFQALVLPPPASHVAAVLQLATASIARARSLADLCASAHASSMADTPTTKPKQYVAYIRTLAKAITVGSKNNRRMRHRWHTPCWSPAADALLERLRLGWEGRSRKWREQQLNVAFGGWLTVQSAEAEVDADELTLAGFVAAFKTILREVGALPDEDAPSSAAAHELVDVFRRFDVSATGLISLADMIAAVVDDTPSQWGVKRGSSKGLLHLSKAAHSIATFVHSFHEHQEQESSTSTTTSRSTSTTTSGSLESLPAASSVGNKNRRGSVKPTRAKTVGEKSGKGRRASMP